MASKSVSRDVRGFTLIEIAIVLVVIGLLLSGGLLAIAPVINQGNVSETEGKMDRIEAALVLYAIQNSCLPCPADATISGTAAEGEQADSNGDTIGAACAGDSGTTVCRSGQTATVPWLTLGLQRSDAIDAWGTLISYHLSDRLEDGGAGECDDFQNNVNAVDPGNGGFLRNTTEYPTGCLDIQDADPAGFATITNEAAYVLISHGRDTSGGYAAERATLAQGRVNNRAGNDVQLDNNEVANTCSDNAGDPCHQGDPIDAEGGDYFDDILRWKSGPLIVYECGEGVCGNP